MECSKNHREPREVLFTIYHLNTSNNLVLYLVFFKQVRSNRKMPRLKVYANLSQMLVFLKPLWKKCLWQSPMNLENLNK